MVSAVVRYRPIPVVPTGGSCGQGCRGRIRVTHAAVRVVGASFDVRRVGPGVQECAAVLEKRGRASIDSESVPRVTRGQRLLIPGNFDATAASIVRVHGVIDCPENDFGQRRARPRWGGIRERIFRDG